MKIFYYTSTGNSLAVAKRIGGELISIPQIDKDVNLEYEDDVIGIIFPIYNHTAPIRVQKFLKRAKLKAKYLFAIGTYGKRAAAAMYDVYNIALSAGNMFDYVEQIIMLDNALDYFDIDEEKNILPKKGVNEKVSKIIDEISQRIKKQANFDEMALEITKISGARQQNLNGHMAKDYIVNEQCVQCGICEKVCPAGNIAVADSVEFGDICEGCQGCLHLCPQNAIHLANEKSNARWRNPEVTLEEIIKSNNQK